LRVLVQSISLQWNPIIIKVELDVAQLEWSSVPRLLRLDHPNLILTILKTEEPPILIKTNYEFSRLDPYIINIYIYTLFTNLGYFLNKME